MGMMAGGDNHQEANLKITLKKEYSEIQSDRISQGGTLGVNLKITLKKSTLKFRVTESSKVLILK
jgi:hypothetical protein